MRESQLRRWITLVGLLASLPVSLAAQQGATITGTVTTQAGLPLVMATVAIDTLTIRTTTDDQGRYTLVIPAARVSGRQVTIAARQIGYRESRSRITLNSGNIQQNFALALNPLRLGEVIVTGSGTVSAIEKLGNTVNTVSNDLIMRSSEHNLVAALAGKAPNVSVSTSSGDPGASTFIRIRGPKTITGTGQPLFVVDGTPLDNTTRNPRVNDPFGGFTGGIATPNRVVDLNPDDIESVEILKGAAAAAIYGARAGQGVVLITTKRGQPGPTHYSWRTSITSDDASRSYPLQRKYGMGFAFEPGGCTANNCAIGTGAAVSFGPLLTTEPTYDHFNEILEKGTQLTNTLSISGGNDRTLFYLSGSTFENNGVIIGDNDNYQRYTIRVNAEHRALDDLKVGANISYADTKGQFVQKGSNTSGLLLGALRTPPEFNQFPYLDATTGMHRSFRFPHPTQTSATTSRGYDNPLFSINEFDNAGTNNRTFGNVNVEWTPMSWLKITETLGADFSQEDQQIGTPKTASTFAQGQIWRNSFNNSSVDHQFVGTANFLVNPDFAGTVTVGHGLNASRFQQVWLQANTLIANKPFKLSNTLERLPPVDEETRVHTDGIFGQVTADLWQQLYLTAGVRYDGSSTFSEESRRNWFPKVSVAWDFTRHAKTFSAEDWMTFGKLRAAYGEVGEQPSAYQLLSVLEVGESFLDGGWGPEVTAIQGGRAALFTSELKGQDRIKPERTTELELGFELGGFNDKADLSVTWYESVSRDVIFLLPQSPSTGFADQVQNAARISNRGWEVVANYRPISRANLGWNIGVQWSNNDNKVLQLAEGVQFVDQNGGFTGNIGSAILGGRVSAQRGLDFVRCGAPDPAPDDGTPVTDIDAACAGAPRGALFIGADGFPIIDGTTRQIVDPQPVWTGSINTSFRINKLRLTALVDHQQGGEVWNGTKGALYFFGTHKDTEKAREGPMVFGESWMPGPTVGPGAGQEVLLVDDAGNNWFAGVGGGFGPVPRQFVEDATFTKLREISASYSLTSEWLRSRLGFNSLDLRIAGRNLKTWTRYTGLDPETNVGGAEVPVQGVDFFNNPQTRSFIFSITLNR